MEKERILLEDEFYTVTPERDEAEGIMGCFWAAYNEHGLTKWRIFSTKVQ